MLLSLGLALFRADLASIFGHEEVLSRGSTALTYFATAWLFRRVAALALDKASTRRRPYPRILNDLIGAVLFLVAFAASVALFMGQDTAGASDPAPDVRVLSYDENGITYALRQWLSRFDRDVDCRNSDIVIGGLGTGRQRL